MSSQQRECNEANCDSPTLPGISSCDVHATPGQRVASLLELESRAKEKVLRELSQVKAAAARREEIIMHEAFMTGRVYAARGEKESPAEINEKLKENCKKAIFRGRGVLP